MTATTLMLIAGAGVATVAGGLVALEMQRTWRRWGMRRRFAKGRAAEGRAAVLLERQGYEIVADQPSRETGIWVDDEWRAVTVRPDFIARRGSKRFVVEVKTGEVAPDPTFAATRRQLLEYGRVFDCDGVLLADMKANRVHRVVFPETDRERRLRRRASVVGAGLVAMLVLGAGALLAAWPL